MKIIKQFSDVVETVTSETETETWLKLRDRDFPIKYFCFADYILLFVLDLLQAEVLTQFVVGNTALYG